MVNFLTLQGSKVDLEGARSTSSSLGDSPAMRLGVGVHPTGPARSMDLVPRGEPYSLACLDLAWLAAARCLYKARRPTCGREGVSPAHSAVRYALPCITVKAGPATRGLWRQCVFCFCIPFLLVSCSGDLLSCAELWLMGLCRVSMQWAGRRETLNPDSLHQWQGCAVLHVMSPCCCTVTQPAHFASACLLSPTLCQLVTANSLACRARCNWSTLAGWLLNKRHHRSQVGQLLGSLRCLCCQGPCHLPCRQPYGQHRKRS